MIRNMAAESGRCDCHSKLDVPADGKDAGRQDALVGGSRVDCKRYDLLMLNKRTHLFQSQLLVMQ